MKDKFIQTQKLYQVVDFEAFLFLLILFATSFIFYKFLLRNVSQERHTNLQNHLKNLTKYFLTLSLFFLTFWFIQKSEDWHAQAVLPYFGFLTFITGAYCFVKTCHLLVLQYLFLGSMKTGVPLLIVNIFSLLLSIVIGFWTVNYIFGVQLTPLLATSAAFSIILGLALQDTLGNLFAGISLQIDKSFEIGNWLEIMNGNNKIVGQVKELSWRSTVLVGFSEELIVLPNKLVASCQISNFSPENNPILRSLTFKFPHQTDIPTAIDTLEFAAAQISEINAQPPPSAFVFDTTENYISIKLIYHIKNYGRQFAVGDKVYSVAIDLLRKKSISIAKPVLILESGGTKNA